MEHTAPTIALQRIESARKIGKVSLSSGAHFPLDASDVSIVLEGVSDVKITSISITATPEAKQSGIILGRIGGVILADALDAHPELESLTIDAAHLGDDGMEELAPAIARHPKLSLVYARNCGISDEGMKTFCDSGAASNPNLVVLLVPQNKDYGESKEVVPGTEELFIRQMQATKSKNLTSSIDDDALDAFTRNNYIQTQTLLKSLPPAGTSTPADWNGAQMRGAYARESSVFHHWNLHYRNDASGDTEKTRRLKERDKTRADFRALLDALPALNDAQNTDALFTPAEEGAAKGFAPLDNPRLWEGKSIEDFKAIPLTKEILEQRTPKGSSLLESAFAAFPAEELLTHLGAKHVKLQRKELLTAEGAPSPLLNQLLDDGVASRLFTKENWAGSNVNNLNAVYAQLPDEVKAQTPYQSIRAYLGSQAVSGRGR